MVCMLVFTATVTPFEVAFLKESLNGMFVINRLVDLSFTIDMALNFVTGRFKSEAAVWVTSFRALSRRYLKSWFWVDVVSVLPFDVVGVAINSSDVSKLKIFQIVRLLRLFKLVRLIKGTRIFARWEHNIGLAYSLQSIVKFVLGMLFAAHWVRKVLCVRVHPCRAPTSHHG